MDIKECFVLECKITSECNNDNTRINKYEAVFNVTTLRTCLHKENMV